MKYTRGSPDGERGTSVVVGDDLLSNSSPQLGLSERPAMAEAAPGSIVKEGWLLKRGEHIRNWRDRYFILFDNGDLVGFKAQPERNNYRDPLNKFTVRDCQIMAVDKPRPYVFTIRGLQWTTVIERNFAVDTEEERLVYANLIPTT